MADKMPLIPQLVLLQPLFGGKMAQFLMFSYNLIISNVKRGQINKLNAVAQIEGGAGEGAVAAPLLSICRLKKRPLVKLSRLAAGLAAIPREQSIGPSSRRPPTNVGFCKNYLTQMIFTAFWHQYNYINPKMFQLAFLQCVKQLKPQSFRGLRPLDPYQGS